MGEKANARRPRAKDQSGWAERQIPLRFEPERFQPSSAPKWNPAFRRQCRFPDGSALDFELGEGVVDEATGAGLLGLGFALSGNGDRAIVGFEAQGRGGW